MNFNPRPREEGDKINGNIWGVVTDFNPRPREEGDLCARLPLYLFLCISIHALVKRATNIIIFVHNLGFISIHALVKRAT